MGFSKMTEREKEINTVCKVVSGILTANNLTLTYENERKCLIIIDETNNKRYVMVKDTTETELNEDLMEVAY